MQLLNELSEEERRWREHQKRYCAHCNRSWVRVRAEQRSFAAIWNGVQILTPRRFVNAKMRVTEELWVCPSCPTAREGKTVSGMWIDFEHVGNPAEIIPVEQNRCPFQRDKAAGTDQHADVHSAFLHVSPPLSTPGASGLHLSDTLAI